MAAPPYNQSKADSYSDITNHSRYEGKSTGIGASANLSGETLGQGAQNDSRLATVADKNGLGFNGVGYGHDSSNRSSTTRNISITGDSGGTQSKAVYTDICTETAEAAVGRLNKAFDKEKVQQELDTQREISQQFSRNLQSAKAEADSRIYRLKVDFKAGKITQDEYDKQITRLQYLKTGLSMLAGRLSAPTDSALGIAAAIVAPAAAYRIGQHYKNNKELNF